MPTVAELREESRLYREASRNEVDPIVRRELAKRALDFAYVAQANELQDAERNKRDKR